jgi:uncharacterized protein with PIN domain
VRAAEIDIVPFTAALACLARSASLAVGRDDAFLFRGNNFTHTDVLAASM